MLDFNVIKSLVDDDNDVVVALLTTYLEDFSDAENQIATYYNTQNWSELYMLSHSLKGTLRVIGEESASQILERIEHDTQAGKTPSRQDLDNAEIELSAIQFQVQHYLSNDISD